MGSKGSNTTTQTSAPDPQAYAAYQSLLSRAQGVASTPYQAYTGEMVAPVNAQQNLGISNINQYAGAAQPNLGTASSMVQNASNPLTQSQIQSYMNPYTQSVVNATQNQFNNANAQQRQQVTGNAIAQGALGGNRTAVAQSELANQQNLAQAPVIANLYNQGYQGALSTAAQQYQQNPMAAAGLLGNLGVAQQTAGLSGAGAQIGAGNLQQQTQQQLDAAQMAQFQQQQAYPYQQAQWLAGLTTGVGSQMGGTGSTTAPGPNPWSQIAGLGIAAAGAFLKDGGRVNGYHRGGVAGYADGGSPGGVAGMPWAGAPSWIPTNNIVHGSGAPRAPQPASSPQQDMSKQASAIGDLAKKLRSGSGDALDYGSSIPGAVGPTSVGGAPLNNMPLSYGASVPNAFGATSVGGAPLNPMYARGGVVGYADGGDVGALERFSRWTNNGRDHGQRKFYNETRAGLLNSETAPEHGYTYGGTGLDLDTRRHLQMHEAQDIGDKIRGYADGGSPDFSDADIGTPNNPYRELDRPSLDSIPPAYADWRHSVNTDLSHPQLNTTPSEEPKGIAPAELPEVITGKKKQPSSGTALAFSGDDSDVSVKPPAESFGIAPPDVRARNESSGVAPRLGYEHSRPIIDFGQNPNLGSALMSAGFGMMASRSPFLGTAIGEGGQAGMASYSAQQQREFEAEKAAQQLQLQREQIERPYSEMTAAQKAAEERAARPYSEMTAAEKAADIRAREQIERPYSEMTAAQKAAEARANAAQTISQNNQPVIMGPNGKPMVNQTYVEAKQAAEKDFKPQLIQSVNPITGETAFRSYDPNTKTITNLTPEGEPASKPTPAPDINTVAVVDKSGMTGLNQAQTAVPYNYAIHAPTIEKGMDVPEPDLQYIPRASAASLKTDAASYLQTGKLPSAPVGRGNNPLAVAAANYRAAVQNYGNAIAQSRGVTPDQLAMMWRTAPDLPKFIIGQPGQATVSLGVAMDHLNTLKQFIDAAKFPDTPRFKQIQAQVSREFGSSAATNVDAAASIVGPEIVKAIGIAGAGTAEERDKASKMFMGGAKQSTDAIGVVQHLLTGQLEGKERQAHAVGMSEDMFKGLIGNKNYDLLKSLDNSTRNTMSKPSLNDFLGAARAHNPGVSDADLTAYYNKKYGTQ